MAGSFFITYAPWTVRRVNNCILKTVTGYTGWAKKQVLFLRVDNFATVHGSKAYDMSEDSEFFLEKVHNLHENIYVYSLHKYSAHVK